MIKYKIISTNIETLPHELMILWADCRDEKININIWYKLGIAIKEHEKGNYYQAIKFVQKIIHDLQKTTFSEKYSVIYHYLAKFYYDNNNFKKAAINYAKARQIWPNSTELIFGHSASIYRYGLILYKQGRTIEAIQHAEKAKEIFEEILLRNPSDTITQQWLLAVNKKLANWKLRVSGDIPPATSTVSVNKRRKFDSLFPPMAVK